MGPAPSCRLSAEELLEAACWLPRGLVCLKRGIFHNFVIPAGKGPLDKSQGLF